MVFYGLGKIHNGILGAGGAGYDVDDENILEIFRHPAPGIHHCTGCVGNQISYFTTAKRRIDYDFD